ncbi:MAG TPA: hypothetical protein VGF17_13480 [Phytomonospora sp.]
MQDQSIVLTPGPVRGGESHHTGLRITFMRATDNLRMRMPVILEVVGALGAQTLGRVELDLARSVAALPQNAPLLELFQALNKDSERHGGADGITLYLPIGPLPKYEIPRSETWLPSGGPAPQPYEGQPMRGWERVLELAGQLDEVRGSDPGKAVELANLITALHDELAEPEEIVGEVQDAVGKLHAQVATAGLDLAIDSRPARPIAALQQQFVPAKAENFRRELASLLNRHSAENGSNTPDFVLADFLGSVLTMFDAAVCARANFYGRMDLPGQAADPQLEEIAKLVFDERGVARDDSLVQRIRQILSLWDNAREEVLRQRAHPASREHLGRANFRVALALDLGGELKHEHAHAVVGRVLCRASTELRGLQVAVAQVAPHEVVLYTRNRPEADHVTFLKKLVSDARYALGRDGNAPGEWVRVDEVTDPLGEDRRKLDWFMDLYSRAKMAPTLLSNLTGSRWAIATAGTVPELAARAALSELGVLDAPTDLLRAQLALEHVKNADGLASKFAQEGDIALHLSQAEEAIAGYRDRFLAPQPIAATGGLAHEHRNLIATMAGDAARELGATPSSPITMLSVLAGDDASRYVPHLLRQAGTGGMDRHNGLATVTGVAAKGKTHKFPRPILIGAGTALEDAPWPIDWRDFVRALFAAGLHTNDDIPQG